MDSEPRHSADRFGLAAFGRSGRWEVSILDSFDRDDEWLAELEADNVYLVIRLTSIAVIPEVLHFVKTVLIKAGSTNGSAGSSGPPSIALGSLGDSPVRLTADWEDIPRCFLIAARGTGTALRVTLGRDDLEMLADALEQAIKDLPANAPAPNLPV